MSEIGVLGRVLKSIRQRRSWTLSEVAERSGISTATLSKVERGKSSLTYGKIIDLARGLDVEIGALFYSGRADTGDVRDTRRSVTRASEGARLQTPRLQYRYLNTDLLNKRFYPVVLDVTARSLKAFGALTEHEGEQFLYVLDGELEVHTEHYAPTWLAKGDAIYFDSTMRHAGVSTGDGPCRVLCVLSSLDGGSAGFPRGSEPRPQRRPAADRF